MKLLIAEDDPGSRQLLKRALARWGFEVVETGNGAEAWAALQSDAAIRLAVLDWMMPQMEGVEVCRRVRALASPNPPYLILLTARSEREDVVAGLDAGADDYLAKPFDHLELRARLQVGCRVVALQEALAARVTELEAALAHVKRLQGIVPICCYCKRIRDDGDFWQQVEEYIAEHSEARFSHGICPECYDATIVPQLEELRRERSARE